MCEDRPLRILHIVGGMNRGGVETWLMHILRHIDRSRFHMDFMVHTDQACAFDQEILAFGSKIIPCLHPSQPWTYARNFKQVLREYGPYHVVHSHVHHYSGYVLRLAYWAGVPVRIAHSHNDTADLEARAGLRRRLYLTLMEQWMSRYATAGLACSKKAGPALFRRRFRKKKPWEPLYYGIDLAPFEGCSGSYDARTELKIAPDAFVIGHVGRFVEQKNHAFVVEIAAEVARHEPNMCLLLVGEGPLRRAIEKKIAERGLSHHVVFAGIRADVPRLMLSVMDVFLFPSLFEGLGLVLVEAQAAGLPYVTADVVPEEVDVVNALACRISLSQPASVWAEAVLAARKKRCRSRIRMFSIK